MDKIKARVIQILLDKYVLENIENGKIIDAYLKGNIKKRNNIIVGDIVELEQQYEKSIIIKLFPRKNLLIRPPVANIDKLIIILSLSKPKPDYMLLDKQLILCKLKNIEPVICINKIDLLDADNSLQKSIEYIDRVYGDLGIRILKLSANTLEGMQILKNELLENISAFSGNSGVGKSSITKSILRNEKTLIEIGEVGLKTNRGKHTTKYVRLYKLADDTYILDTPGFSSYELYDVSYKELARLYEEFNSCNCDFEDCRHVNEDIKVCEVKTKVENGMIDKDRYDRYVYMYNELKEKDKYKYK